MLIEIFGRTIHMTHSEKPHVVLFHKLLPWHRAILSSVKKDLRNEHLRADRAFFKKYFGLKVLQKLTLDDLMQVYPAVIAEGHEKLAEFIVNRWLLRHINIYTQFEMRLKKIHAKIDEILEIDDALSQELIDDSCKAFGAVNTYIFCMFNGVNFSETMMESLCEKAHDEVSSRAAAASV